MTGMEQYLADTFQQLFGQADPGMTPEDNGNSVQKDPDGYPFEPVDSFSLDPIGFKESSRMLLREADDVFRMTRFLNRQSPSYMQACRNLEKLVRQLGSCCVTWAAMQQAGKQIPALQNLSISRLGKMVSFNMRKCHAGYMEARNEGIYLRDLSEMVCSWNSLLKRLDSTETRIRAILEGREKVDLTLAGPQTPADIHPVNDDREKPAMPLREKAASFPVDKAALCRETETSAEPEAELCEAGPVSVEIPCAEISEDDDPVTMEELLSGMFRMRDRKQPVRWEPESSPSFCAVPVFRPSKALMKFADSS